MPDNSRLERIQDTQTRARRSDRSGLLDSLCCGLTAVRQGSRDLDVAIGEALGLLPTCTYPADTFGWMDAGGGVFIRQHPDGSGQTQQYILPEWSGSVDAALSAMQHLPDCYTYTLTGNDDGSHSAVVGRRAGFVLSNTSWGGSAPTPALAMMIAIVRAMQEGA